MLINKKLILILTIAASLQACSPEMSSGEQALLHVASPEWQDQIIYFLMIDRFNDGDLSNSDQGVGVYERGAKDKYNGGDLQGVIDKLDYIQDLGATAVWTTPQVANQWWDPIAQYWGYHGYWARDFKSVDEHYGTLEDYQDLSKSLHARDMYLIQDIVVNHTGNFFYYDGEYDASNVANNFNLNTDSIPTTAPTQDLLRLNDVNNAEHKQLNTYNWTPAIKDVSVFEQETTYQTAGLDDMNTKNPLVRYLLKDSFGYWIKEAGVDAFRIDTAKYVEKEFYEDFLHGDSGIVSTAASTGRMDFFTFGEIYETSPTKSTAAEQKISHYLGSEGTPRMAAPIGFPLYFDIQNVFAGGRPTSYLSFRLKAAMNWYKNPHLAVNFIDNHDVERFLANGTLAGFKQAYAFLMSVPGIPAIYQGDEQEHILKRQAMFAKGFGSENDQFNTQSNMYGYIQRLAKMRLANKVFSRGSIDILQDNELGPGILAYKRQYQGQEAYIVFNSGEQSALLSSLHTSFWGGNEIDFILAEGVTQALPVAADGTLTMIMPARSTLIFSGKSKTNATPEDKAQQITVDPIPEEFNDMASATVSGTVSSPNVQLLRVIDGKLAQAKALVSDAEGKWSTELPVEGLGRYQHSVEIYWPENNLVSENHSYSTNSTEVSFSASKVDIIGDDKGIDSGLVKPGYLQKECYLDIESVEAKAGGGNMQLTVKMCDISTSWAPPNGFDHLALTIHMDIKGLEGKQNLPLLSADMPHNRDWNFAHSAFGWENYIFSTEQSSAKQEGIILNYTPEITVDVERKELRIVYRGERLGVDSWQDSALYITTWDKDEDGNYRHINIKPSKWHFSSNKQSSARIADDVFIELKANAISPQ